MVIKTSITPTQTLKLKRNGNTKKIILIKYQKIKTINNEKHYLFNLIIIWSLSFSALMGQDNRSITIGIDPLVIGVLNGFEVEAGYNFDKNRVTIEYLGAELPSVWNSQIDDFEQVSADIFEVGYSRLYQGGVKRISLWCCLFLFFKFEVQTAAGQTLTKDISKIGIRLGYLWFPFKNANFFVEPLFNFGIYLGDEDLDFGNGTVFEESTLLAVVLLFT